MVVSVSVLSTGGNWFNMFWRRMAASSLPVRQRVAEVTAAVNKDLVSHVIVDDLRVWPVYDVICFAAIPPAARPISTAIVLCGWSTYISIVSARQHEEIALDGVDETPPQLDWSERQ